MALNLRKGGSISLSKADPSLKRAVVGLGWDPHSAAGATFDLDVSTFLLAVNGRVRSDADFIFYNQARSLEGSVEYSGDNRTGEGQGDDEQVKINLTSVPHEVARIVFVVSIDEYEQRRQNFGQVSNAFIRVVNAGSGLEIVRYDLSEDYSTATSVIFGELYRQGSEWQFKAVGDGRQGGLRAACQRHGVNMA